MGSRQPLPLSRQLPRNSLPQHSCFAFLNRLSKGSELLQNICLLVARVKGVPELMLLISCREENFKPRSGCSYVSDDAKNNISDDAKKVFFSSSACSVCSNKQMIKQHRFW